MPVAIVDVGSNTARLLVVERTASGLEAICEERAYLALGSLIAEHGELPAAAIRDTARCVTKYVRSARRLGAREIDVLVTSPGRQTANGDELLAALAGAGATLRLLSPEEEGALAFEGVLSVCGPVDGLVAVCDVGGGSTQVVVGSADGGPAWVRSVDLGSARLTRRSLRDDPPDEKAIAAARAHVARCFADMAPPLPTTAFATGGTARALKKIVGARLGPDELAVALKRVAPFDTKARARAYDLAPWRASVLPAGILILEQIERRLAVPLQVARAGIREGAALQLLERAAAA
jgi:exopolyphosphatase / guanosine-5'-triphosphate,3'-diphosphate pyrophosphatase